MGYLNRYADKQKRWKLSKEERDRLVERFVSSARSFVLQFSALSYFLFYIHKFI